MGHFEFRFFDLIKIRQIFGSNVLIILLMNVVSKNDNQSYLNVKTKTHNVKCTTVLSVVTFRHSTVNNMMQ